MANLTDKAMLVRLSISQWTAKKYDKSVSRKVAADYETAEDAGRYNKVLIAQDAIKAIAQIATDARTFHYANTLPWNDDGDRILPSANYLSYTQKLQEYRQQFTSAVYEFIDNYPALIQDARQRLNGMFRAEDYPTIGRISGKYNFDVAVMPLPSSADFRVSLQADEVESIKADIETRTKQAEQSALADLWQRLHDVVSHMADKLQDDKAIFRDSLVGNVAELCELLPRLNVFADPHLEALRQQVESKLLQTSAQTLREDKAARQQTATDASAILDAMAGYMGDI